MAYNKFIFSGNLGGDAELSYTPTGKAVCKFSVAVSDRRGGEEKTMWVRCALWEKRGEALQQYLTKGQKVLVEGRLAVSTYTNRAGEPQASVDVTVSEIELLGSRSDSGDSHPAQSAKAAAFDAQKPVAAIDADESVPF